MTDFTDEFLSFFALDSENLTVREINLKIIEKAKSLEFDGIEGVQRLLWIYWGEMGLIQNQQPMTLKYSTDHLEVYLQKARSLFDNLSESIQNKHPRVLARLMRFEYRFDLYKTGKLTEDVIEKIIRCISLFTVSLDGYSVIRCYQDLVFHLFFRGELYTAMIYINQLSKLYNTRPSLFDENMGCWFLYVDVVKKLKMQIYAIEKKYQKALEELFNFKDQLQIAPNELHREKMFHLFYEYWIITAILDILLDIENYEKFDHYKRQLIQLQDKIEAAHQSVYSYDSNVKYDLQLFEAKRLIKSQRIKDKAKAQEILEGIQKEIDPQTVLSIKINLMLMDILYYELNQANKIDPSLIKEFLERLSVLRDYAETVEWTAVIINIMVMDSKLLMISGELIEAREMLLQAINNAKQHRLMQDAEKYTQVLENFDSSIAKWETLVKSDEYKKQIKEAQINEYMDLVSKITRANLSVR